MAVVVAVNVVVVVVVVVGRQRFLPLSPDSIFVFPIIFAGVSSKVKPPHLPSPPILPPPLPPPSLLLPWTAIARDALFQIDDDDDDDDHDDDDDDANDDDVT